MQEPTIRKWHRRVGVAVGGLIFLQAMSGLLLSIEWLMGYHTRVGALIDATGVPEAVEFWDWLFVNVHYGGGQIGALYHAVLGLGLIWLVGTGFSINHKIQARLRLRSKKSASGS